MSVQVTQCYYATGDTHITLHYITLHYITLHYIASTGQTRGI